MKPKPKSYNLSLNQQYEMQYLNKSWNIDVHFILMLGTRIKEISSQDFI
jgi:hypothetical protein